MAESSVNLRATAMAAEVHAQARASPLRQLALSYEEETEIVFE